MIHHSLTQDGETVSWGAIEHYHKAARGWQDIGYHYGVERIQGRPYALIGRGENQVAAACREGQMNSRALHVCCVGNYDLEPPAPDTLDVLIRRVLLPLMDRYRIPAGNIVGHHAYAPYKSCPGIKFNLTALRASLPS
jgi:hypothetical protein